MTTETILVIGSFLNNSLFIHGLTDTKSRYSHGKISPAKIISEKIIKDINNQDFMKITQIEYPNNVNHTYIYLINPKNIVKDSEKIKEKLEPMNIGYIICSVPDAKNKTINKWYHRATKFINKKIPYVFTSYRGKYYFFEYRQGQSINFDNCDMRWETMMRLHTFAFDTKSLISPAIINKDATDELVVQQYLDKLVVYIPKCIDNQRLREDLTNENNLIISGLAIKINNILSYIYKYPDIFSLVIPFDTKLDITKKILLAYFKVTFPYMLITNITDNDFIINW